MRNPMRTSAGRRSAVVTGVALVTMVASVGATVTGAVRPARSRPGRFYRPPSGVVWAPGRGRSGGRTVTSTADALDAVTAWVPPAVELEL